jgi:hypothetical protein
MCPVSRETTIDPPCQRASRLIDAPLWCDRTGIRYGSSMSEPQQYSRRAVFWARTVFVVAGCAIIGLGTILETLALSVAHFLGYAMQILGAVILGFGAFARGTICTDFFLRVLNRLVN